MRKNFIDFRWFRDPTGRGYVLEAGRESVSRPAAWPDENATLVAAAPILTLTARVSEKIVHRGGPLEEYKPIDEYGSQIIDRFITVAGDAKGALRFVNTFGPLSRKAVDGQGEEVEPIIKHAHAMRALRDALERGDEGAVQQALGPKGRSLGEGPVGTLDAKLVYDPITGKPRIVLVPPNLMMALWLTLAHEITSGAVPRTCQHCGAIFWAGDGGRRIDSKFCSSDHQIKFNSLRRAGVKEPSPRSPRSLKRSRRSPEHA